MQFINIHCSGKKKQTQKNVCNLWQPTPALFLLLRLITGNAEELQSLPLSLIKTIPYQNHPEWCIFPDRCHDNSSTSATAIQTITASSLGLLTPLSLSPPPLPPNRNMFDWQENSCAVITAGKPGDSASTERSHPRLTW